MNAQTESTDVAVDPRPLTAPQTVGDSSKFQKMFMRPNLANGNNIPATGTLSCCPDIWPAGTTPVANFQTALATPDSYKSQSPSSIVLQADNYIYVRGCNGSANTTSTNVTLFYAPSGVIQHPSYWQNNIIKTDQGNTSANITNLAPGAVGVADQTFVWQQVQPPPSGSDHYCLMAQFNDAQNSNPIPDPSAPLDLSALVKNNLRWGWHNISLISAPAGFNFSFSTDLEIPGNFQPNNYSVIASPVGYTGWYISYQCSQPDSNGNPIVLAKSLITADGAQYGGAVVYLEPGYKALLTVYMYNDNNKPTASGARVPISANYVITTKQELEEAVDRGLVDEKATEHVRQLHPGGTFADGIPIHAIAALGDVTAITKPRV